MGLAKWQVQAKAESEDGIYTRLALISNGYGGQVITY